MVTGDPQQAVLRLVSVHGRVVAKWQVAQLMRRNSKAPGLAARRYADMK